MPVGAIIDAVACLGAVLGPVTTASGRCAIAETAAIEAIEHTVVAGLAALEHAVAAT